MLIVKQLCNRAIDLFRGEPIEKYDQLRREGVRPKAEPLGPGFPSSLELQLDGLEPSLIAILAEAELLKHVLDGSHQSPFLSWTSSRQTAIGYALGGGRKSEGLILRLRIVVTSLHTWSGLRDSDTGGFFDAVGRSWICVERARFLRAEATTPDASAVFAQFGRRDAEFLCLGSIAPSELAVAKATRQRVAP